MTNQEIITRGELIRDETVTGANTAQRVGEAFVAIGENLEEVGREISKVNSFSNDYYKEFAVGEVPVYNANIESFGFGGKTGDTLKVSVEENTWKSAVYLALYGKSTESDSWERIFINYSKVIVTKLLESDYAELGFSLGSTITSATVKASLIDGKASLLDILSKVDGYYTCTSSPQNNKEVNVDWYRLRNGGKVIINFIYSNTKPAPVTLNINGTGAKMIYIDGKPVGLDNTWQNGSICLVWYDGNRQHYNAKVLWDNNGDISADNIKILQEICLNSVDWKDITEITFTTGRKYNLNSANGYEIGHFVETNSYLYSEPIQLVKGESIKVKSFGNLYCPIQESDENGNIMARLVVETNDTSSDRTYTFIATKNMYVVVNVQNVDNHPYSVNKSIGMSTLLNLLEISKTVCNGPVSYNNPIFTSNDVSVGDVIYYEVEPTGGNGYWSLYLEDENGQHIGGLVRAYSTGDIIHGKLTIPEGFSYARNTRGHFKSCKIAKAGTIVGENIAQVLMAEELDGIKSAIENDSSLPLYYKDYLDEKESEIRNLQLNISGEEDSFIFITDTHWIDNYKQSPAIIASLLKRGLTNMVVFGGDLMGLHSDVDMETQNETLEYIKTQIDFHRKFESSLLACGAKFFNVRGNHDINGYPAKKTTQGADSTIEMWRASENATKNILVGNIVEKNVFYYVFDNAAKKMRYIFLGGSNAMGIYDGQFYGESWLISALNSTPSNYDVVVFCHYGATITTLKPYIPKVDGILTAFNARQSGTVGSVTYDFTSIVGSGKVIAYVSGHTHRNLQNFSAGVVHICTACDASYSESPYLNEKSYSRSKDTVTEQIFDFIQIDKAANMIYCKRIGAGYDRYFHTQPNTVANRNSITLQPIMLSGELTWGAYDNNCDKSSKADKTDQNPVTSTRVSVLSGVVTGNADAVGEAVVYAMDETGNREFFEVIVE